MTGAYAVLRHPSYSAWILMNPGLGLALGSWGSAAVLTLMGARRRLIPFVY